MTALECQSRRVGHRRVDAARRGARLPRARCRGLSFAEAQDVGDVLSGQGFRGCYPLDHIGEPPGEVDNKRFERQPAATGAVSEWLQAPLWAGYRR
jgi:hypothetical protein